ncbi:MAG: beta-aspartyl-peptidase (threonine type) [Planctomycetota bacterium]|jgi:beta-aspartyl-peptidase (threonine type)
MHRFSASPASGVTRARSTNVPAAVVPSAVVLAAALVALALTGCRASSPDATESAPMVAIPAAIEALSSTLCEDVAAQPGGALALDGPALEIVDDVVLAIHGGAGTIRRDAMTPELEAAYRAALADALLRGHRVLADGGRAADAVEAALHPLEDSHLFNAGRGAVLTDDGTVEMDASIMLGRSGMAGAIAGAHTVRHPISAARAVLEKTEHVLLSGTGADRFVTEQGLQTMPPEWFVTSHRQRQLELLQATDSEKVGQHERALGPDHKFGTVGCVALDHEGHLAAGTSTGGMARKAWGRIGDSPLIGAGTWADDRTCAVSCTGWGEFFIRKAIAHQIHARMLFGGAGIGAAAAETILDELPKGGGSGGCIALDSGGRLAAPFTTPGMYRGWVDAQGRVTVRIYGDERH